MLLPLALLSIFVACHAQRLPTSCFTASKNCELCKTPRMFKDCREYCVEHCPSSYMYVPPEGTAALANLKPIRSRVDQSMPLQEPNFAKSANLFDRKVNSPEIRLQDTLGRLGTIVRNDYPSKKYVLKHGDDSPFLGDQQSLATKCPNEINRPCITVAKANKRILDCCKQIGMPQECLQYCNMDVSLEKLVAMDLNPACTNELGLAQAQCVTKGADLRDCCRDAGIPEPCVAYCYPNSNPPPPTDVGFEVALDTCAPLVENTQAMQRCFYLAQQPDPPKPGEEKEEE